MRLRYKILIGLLLVLLIGPFLVPVNTSGTLTKEQAAEEVWGSQSQFVELAGQEVHYVTAGSPSSKKLIVLLHGFGASAFSYKETIIKPKYNSNLAKNNVNDRSNQCLLDSNSVGLA